jgi:hypothetical protein
MGAPLAPGTAGRLCRAPAHTSLPRLVLPLSLASPSSPQLVPPSTATAHPVSADRSAASMTAWAFTPSAKLGTAGRSSMMQSTKARGPMDCINARCTNCSNGESAPSGRPRPRHEGESALIGPSDVAFFYQLLHVAVIGDASPGEVDQVLQARRLGPLIVSNAKLATFPFLAPNLRRSGRASSPNEERR